MYRGSTAMVWYRESATDHSLRSGTVVGIEALRRFKAKVRTTKEIRPIMSLDNHRAMVNARVFLANVDIAEVYSPPRVVPVARQMGLIGGSSLDITTTDDNGEPWDFSQKHECATKHSD